MSVKRRRKEKKSCGGVGVGGVSMKAFYRSAVVMFFLLLSVGRRVLNIVDSKGEMVSYSEVHWCVFFFLLQMIHSPYSEFSDNLRKK